MIKFLYDLIVNNDIIANTFRRESDNSEVAYDNDLHTVAKSGDYNDLINPPSDYSVGQELLMDLWIENGLSQELGPLDAGYWYVNNRDTSETFLTENRTDVRIESVYDRTNNKKIYEIEDDQRFDDYPYYPTQD